MAVTANMQEACPSFVAQLKVVDNVVEVKEELRMCYQRLGDSEYKVRLSGEGCSSTRGIERHVLAWYMFCLNASLPTRHVNE